jgi:hypothetical protein
MTASARFISTIMASLTNAIDIVPTSVINMQLKPDILNEAVKSVSVAVPSDEVIDILDEPSDPPLPADTNMLDALLNNIDENYTINDATPDDQDTADAANKLCENELYQLLLGHDFRKCGTLKPRPTTVLCLVGNCQPADSSTLRGLLSSILQFLLHPPHLSASRAKLLESSRSNEIGCRRRLLLLSCIAEKIGSFCTSTMRRLLRRGCIMMNIVLLKNTRLFCLHLNMKIGATLENSLRIYFFKNIFFTVQCCRYGVLYEYSS